MPPVAACEDDLERRDPRLLEVIPRERKRAYKIRPLVEMIVDRDSFFEKARSGGAR